MLPYLQHSCKAQMIQDYIVPELTSVAQLNSD